MDNPIFCPKCKRELTGAIELVSTTVGNFIYVVSQETADCNWRRCRGCRTVLCKICDDEQREYCCDEGRIVARERAGVAPTQQASQGQQICESHSS